MSKVAVAGRATPRSSWCGAVRPLPGDAARRCRRTGKGSASSLISKGMSRPRTAIPVPAKVSSLPRRSRSPGAYRHTGPLRVIASHMRTLKMKPLPPNRRMSSWVSGGSFLRQAMASARSRSVSSTLSLGSGLRIVSARTLPRIRAVALNTSAATARAGAAMRPPRLGVASTHCSGWSGRRPRGECSAPTVRLGPPCATRSRYTARDRVWVRSRRGAEHTAVRGD